MSLGQVASDERHGKKNVSGAFIGHSKGLVIRELSNPDSKFVNVSACTGC